MNKLMIHTLCDYLHEDLEAGIVKITETYNENSGIYQPHITFVLSCEDWIPSDTLKFRNFEITCFNCLESTLSISAVKKMEWLDDHPLLLKYNQTQMELFFSSKPRNSYEILGRMLLAHEKAYQGWRALSDLSSEQSSYRTLEDLIPILEGGYGLLARGPTPVMYLYYEALSPFLQLELIPDNINIKKPQNVLILDRSYIICDLVSVLELKDGQNNETK